MSYLVLARKARPQTFDEVVGQRPVVKTLQNSLLRDRVAHAILFSGIRGVGKTTLARIMAKAINCTNGPALNPCNICESCQAITTGSSLDLYEIDGASNRGIQEIRELKEKIRFLPVSSKYRIIIIDEVHMLTTEAFNALLKTLEEPPAHVFFMFATTELHKIPITILSRCQRYELKRVAPIELGRHLYNLAEAEGVQIEQGALDLIIREADGSVRDGLSLLDQVFSFGEKSISTDDVIQVLGLVNREVVLRLTKALLENEPGAALQALDEIFSFGMDLKRFTIDLLGSFRALILCRIKGCEELLDMSEHELLLFHDLAGKHSTQSLHMKLHLLMQGVEELRYAGQPRLVIETTFLKIMESTAVTPVTTLLSRLDKLLAAGNKPGEGQLGESHEQVSAPGSSIAKKKMPGPPLSDQSNKYQNIAEKGELLAKDIVPESAAAPLSLVTNEQQSSFLSDRPALSSEVKSGPEEKKITPLLEPHQRNVRRDWMDFIAYVRDRSVWIAQDLQRADSVKEQGGELLLHYQESANCTLLRKDDTKKLITEYVLDFFQKELTISFILPEGGETAQSGQQGPLKERHLLANDPLVLITAEIFNGQIGDIRVGPRFR